MSYSEAHLLRIPGSYSQFGYFIVKLKELKIVVGYTHSQYTTEHSAIG